MTAPRRAVGGATATRSIAGLTIKRLWRGRAVWISVLLAAVPVAMSNLIHGPSGRHLDDLLEVSIFLIAIIPTLHVASSLAEELEDKTAAYLWSRPIPRWSIVTGKLVALVPFTAALLIVGAFGAAANIGAWGTTLAPARVAIGLGLGVIAASCCAVGIATTAPKHGAAVAFLALLFVDIPIGLVPASLANLSITHHVREIVYENGALTASPLIGLGVISTVWLVITFTRVRRLE